MIFEAPDNRRWQRIRLAFAALGVLSLAVAGVFVASVLVGANLPHPEDAPRATRVDWVEVPLNNGDDLSDAASSGQAAIPKKFDALFGERKCLRTAFVIQESPRSIGDLRNSAQDLDAVFPNWYAWTGPAGGLQEQIQPELARFLAAKPLMVLPLISNADSKGVWHGKDVGRMLASKPAGDKVIAQLAEKIAAAGAQGINVDFESLTPRDRANYVAWLRRLTDEFHRRKLFVTIDVPMADEAFDYEAIGRIVDAVVVMAYDEHYATGQPGPIASVEWVREGIDRLSGLVPPEKMILALGAFGYDWDVSSGQPAKALSFTDTMVLADSVDGVIETDKTSLNSHFTYKEPDGDQHEVWFLDAVTAWNHFLKLQEAHVGGFSLWRLGMEEPGIWTFLTCEDYQNYDRNELITVKTSQSVVVEGAGEIFRVRETSADGKRELTFDGRMIDYAAYVKLPHYAVVEKRGRADSRKIALTFDDGPDPKWTPQILQALRDNDVKATFFLVGNRAQGAADLVKREYEEGHVLGNHTFTHPHLGKVSKARLRWEVDGTQRVIEAATGRQTVLFRSPFDTDTTPLSPEQFGPLHEVCDRGYYLVGADIDSDDWEAQTPSAEVLVRNVLEGLKRTESNIIVFHDAGGKDRRQTVEAVRELVPLLKKQGYQFVTVDELMGMPRDTVMPAAPQADRAFNASNAALAAVRTWSSPLLWGVLTLASAMAVLRVVGLGTMIIHSALRRRVAAKPGFAPPVAVLVPAYNEGKVIRRTIESLLQNDYPNLRILVIDDGSTDNTAEVVAAMAEQHPQVRLVTKANGGKASALNVGLAAAEEDYVVTIDADTIIMPGTVRHLMAPFADASVDAVCGNVQVGNVNSLLTTFQDVEYVTTQNYDRRAWEALNCITVVPGATGAWKRQALLDIGGYSTDTLTEDADLTISLLRAGGKIIYAPLARSVTEAPEDLTALFKQRFRWRYGMLQCLWKHRGALGQGLLGLVALPNMLSQTFFELLSPICDLLLVLAIVQGHFGKIAELYLVFLGLDLLMSMVAFTLDRRGMLSILAIPLQRFCYRPFLYWVTIKSVLAMLRGRRHGWNKLQRQNSVKVGPEALPVRPAPQRQPMPIPV